MKRKTFTIRVTLRQFSRDGLKAIIEIVASLGGKFSFDGQADPVYGFIVHGENGTARRLFSIAREWDMGATFTEG